MTRIYALMIFFVLLAFECLFLAFTFDDYHTSDVLEDFAMHAMPGFVACAVACGMIVALRTLLTGKDPMDF